MNCMGLDDLGHGFSENTDLILLFFLAEIEHNEHIKQDLVHTNLDDYDW